MNEARAMERVDADLGHALLNRGNTAFADVNAARPVRWFDIDPRKFGNDLHLPCAGNSGPAWLKIEANTFPNPAGESGFRPDRGVIDLEISCDVHQYMRDVKSGGRGYDFRPHIRRERD